MKMRKGNSMFVIVVVVMVMIVAKCFFFFFVVVDAALVVSHFYLCMLIHSFHGDNPGFHNSERQHVLFLVAFEI